MDETKLPISFGMASNKMMAKIATDEAKPNGYLQVPFGKEKEFLAPMKVSKIPGVGEHTYEVLKAMGIVSIKDISEKTPEELEERRGKGGIEPWYKSQGSQDKHKPHGRRRIGIPGQKPFEKCRQQKHRDQPDKYLQAPPHRQLKSLIAGVGAREQQPRSRDQTRRPGDDDGADFQCAVYPDGQKRLPKQPFFYKKILKCAQHDPVVHQDEHRSDGGQYAENSRA